MNEGSTQRAAGQLDSALMAYRRIYAYDSTYSGNLYNMATAFSLMRQFDSCFFYLYKANNIRLSDDALTDPDLYPARKDPRWDSFERQLIALLRRKDSTTIKNLDYARQLWRIAAADQAYYYDLKVVEERAGKRCPASWALWDLKERINEQNRKDLEVLLTQYGWPKISEVGYQAANAAFLVVQHWDATRQRQYLPTLMALCKANEASWQCYALMYDRIQVDEGKPQRYGSQVRLNSQTGKNELFPLEDEAKVDEWRSEAGLGPLKDYARQWGIIFEPKQQ